MAKINIAEIRLVELTKLKQHEDADRARLKELKKEINLDKVLKFAIIADENTNIILDGEHRFNALKELGCKTIPVVYVDYYASNIQVNSWKKNNHLKKEDVIEAGLSGKRFPPRTSRHMIRIGSGLFHISTLEKRVDIPLKKLRIKNDCG
jgi:ParB-like chromosome segregation protein Spo0J